MMVFLLLMIFGLIHLCMLMSVKYMVNFSAFAAGRARLVGGDTKTAATEGLGYMSGWWGGSYTGLNTPYIQGPIDKTIRNKKRTGFSSTFAVPFGLPIFNSTQPCGSTNAQTCGVRLIGFSPATTEQKAGDGSISHEGDNGGS